MAALRLFFCLVIAMTLSACAGLALEGANITKDQVVYENNIEAAEAGDAEAQYRVGDSLCCSPKEDEGVFYNTARSVAWLCKAARQNHGPAMNMLGKIYSGDTVDGLRVIRRVALGVAGDSTNDSVAYFFFRRAADAGIGDARESATDVWEDLDAERRMTATKYYQGDLAVPCEWQSVFSGAAD